MIKLCIILLLVIVTSCEAKTKSTKSSTSSYDINGDLGKFIGDSVSTYRKVQLDTIVSSLIRNDSIGATIGKSQDSSLYLLTVRPKTGYVEIHEQYDDVVIIRSGSGTLKTGHQVGKIIRSDGVEPSRNWFCDSINNATMQKLSPGDFFIIPAMTAHQYLPDAGDTLTYWTIKVKRLKRTM